MKELNNLNLEEVSGGYIFVVSEDPNKDVDVKIKVENNWCIYFVDKYIATEDVDVNKPFSQRQHSNSFCTYDEAKRYAMERGWSTEFKDFRIRLCK